MREWAVGDLEDMGWGVGKEVQGTAERITRYLL